MARKYTKLLGKTQPVVIETEAEYHGLLDAARELMEKDEQKLTPEESRVLKLLTILIEEYEDRAHPLPSIQPHKMLAYLMQERGVTAAGLAPALPKSRVSEILNGKRSAKRRLSTWPHCSGSRSSYFRNDGLPLAVEWPRT